MKEDGKPAAGDAESSSTARRLTEEKAASAGSKAPDAAMRKMELDIENVALDIESKKRLKRFGAIPQILPSFAVIVAVSGLVVSVWQYHRQQEQHETDTRNAAQREFMKPLLEKELSLFLQASTAAATIASTEDEGERKRAKNEFWRLYWGPMAMFESKEVARGMESFGCRLEWTDFCSNVELLDNCKEGKSLKDCSLALASTLEGALLQQWNAKPEDFAAGQFQYK